MSEHYVLRLIPPRPTFPGDITDGEREIMARHSAYWSGLMENGKVVVYGPVQERAGSYGLGVLEAEDEAEVRAIAAADPASTSGLATIEIGTMLRAFLR